MRRPHGFSMVEAVLATVIVAGMFVAAINTLGASGSAQYKFGRYRHAVALAQDLMAEILVQDYAGTGTPEGSGETTRVHFDEIDDYDGWVASPPQNKDGTTIPGLTKIIRSVSIDYVSPVNFKEVGQTDLGAKRITVSVSSSDGLIASLVAVRTSGKEDLEQ